MPSASTLCVPNERTNFFFFLPYILLTHSACASYYPMREFGVVDADISSNFRCAVYDYFLLLARNKSLVSPPYRAPLYTGCISINPSFDELSQMSMKLLNFSIFANVNLHVLSSTEGLHIYVYH
jgi:hypothetical protein